MEFIVGPLIHRVFLEHCFPGLLQRFWVIKKYMQWKLKFPTPIIRQICLYSNEFIVNLKLFRKLWLVIANHFNNKTSDWEDIFEKLFYLGEAPSLISFFDTFFTRFFFRFELGSLHNPKVKSWCLPWALMDGWMDGWMDVWIEKALHLFLRSSNQNADGQNDWILFTWMIRSFLRHLPFPFKVQLQPSLLLLTFKNMIWQWKF